MLVTVSGIVMPGSSESSNKCAGIAVIPSSKITLFNVTPLNAYDPPEDTVVNDFGIYTLVSPEL